MENETKGEREEECRQMTRRLLRVLFVIALFTQGKSLEAFFFFFARTTCYGSLVKRAPQNVSSTAPYTAAIVMLQKIESFPRSHAGSVKRHKCVETGCFFVLR